MPGLTTSKAETGPDKDVALAAEIERDVRIARDVDIARDANIARNADIARDFARIHSVITYALNVSIEHSQRYLMDGYPDPKTRKGFASYVRCLSALLYAHHVTEDDLVFPYFWEKFSAWPVERLIAQHQQMDPLLDEIQTELAGLTDFSQESQCLARLTQALTEMLALWLAHIEVEEFYLTSERIRAVLDQAEQARIRRSFTGYSRRQQRRAAPLSLLVPFVLYNLSREERPDLAPKMARIVTRVLIPYVWKRKWMPMAPFLREPPQV